MTSSPFRDGERPTLLAALDQLRTAGYGGQQIAAAEGRVRCTACDTDSPAEQITVDGYYRLEGTSDVADLNLLTWARCPACGTGGTLTLGYGPNSSLEDAAVLDALDLESAHTPGQPYSKSATNAARADSNDDRTNPPSQGM